MFQNYLANKDRYIGIGNFNEEGGAFTENRIPLNLRIQASDQSQGLRLFIRTDAGIGAHDRNAEEIIYRVRGPDGRNARIRTHDVRKRTCSQILQQIAISENL